MPGSIVTVLPADERGGVAPDEIRRLVAVHAEAVAEAVGEVRAVSGVLDHLARGPVDVSAPVAPARSASMPAACARSTIA